MVVTPLQAQHPRRFVFDDLINVDRVADAVITARGDAIAVVVERQSATQVPRKTSKIWMVSTRDRQLRPLPVDTLETEQRSPQWSPDGQMLAYVATRGHADFLSAT